MRLLVEMDDIEPRKQSCGHDATDDNAIPETDPCAVCSAYANGYRKDGFFKWREKFELQDFTSCSEATRALAEVQRVASIRDTFSGELGYQTWMTSAGQRKLVSRAKRVLRTDPNLKDPMWWIATRTTRRDHLEVLFDLITMDKKCWLLVVTDPALNPEFVTGARVNNAKDRHRFTREEALALVAHPSAGVRAVGLEMMGALGSPKPGAR